MRRQYIELICSCGHMVKRREAMYVYQNKPCPKCGADRFVVKRRYYQ